MIIKRIVGAPGLVVGCGRLERAGVGPSLLYSDVERRFPESTDGS
jgi:hypothetical protein